jgi:hypothetical protein
VLKVVLPILAVDIEIVHKHLQEFASQFLETRDIVLVKVLVAFLRPKGMTV